METIEIVIGIIIWIITAIITYFIGKSHRFIIKPTDGVEDLHIYLLKHQNNTI